MGLSGTVVHLLECSFWICLSLPSPSGRLLDTDGIPMGSNALDYQWAEGRLWLGVYMARSLFENREIEPVLPHGLKCCFSCQKKWQARESSPIFEIQFNSRSDGMLFGPVEKVVRVPTGVQSFGHQHQSMFQVVPYFSILPILVFLDLMGVH